MTAIALLFLALQIVSPSSSEIDAQLEAVRRQIRDPNRPVEQRASIALEESATLDKMAQGTGSLSERRTRAVQAITLLDDFNAANPRHSLEVPVAIQAAVYLWADGRREFDQWRLAPKDETSKIRAREVFDSTVVRFERIEPALSGADPLVAQNARFRLAQALTDRSQLDPPGSDAERATLRRGLECLEPVPTEAAVVGYARLLRAEIRARLGNFDVAESELDAALKAKERPSTESVVEVQSTILCGQRRFTSAIKAVDESKVDPVTKAALGIKIRLAQRRAISAGQERREADDDAIHRGQQLRGSPRVDARLALIDMAREIDHPSPHSEPDAWDILADGAVGLGDPARAARLLELGADRARDGGRRDEAGRLRLRAGAIVFQAGDYPEANAICGRVWDDSKSGPSRPKAGMLRVLARGRMIAARSAGTTRAGYLAAMNDLLRDYPNDPSTGEARWLLGANELAAGRPAAAMAHWEAIAPGQPRWISARLAIAEQLQRELDTLRIADNPTVVAESYKSAVSSLRKSLARDAEESESLDLELTLIRLDLTPGVGHPDHARSLCDRVAHRAGSDAQHARARMLRVIALAMIQQFAEAEREARVEGVRASSDDLLLAARLLDHSADATESDVNRSRIGRILRLLLVAGARHLDKLPPAGQAEARLRAIRAEIAVGDTESARRAFTEPNGPNAADLDPDSLRDLADAYFRVEAYGMAIDVERLRIRGLKPGSPEWIESRYGLALALYRDKKPREAQRIIDATAILHPELGGGSLKARFERLRQRIEPE